MKCTHELPVSVLCPHCARQQGAADERATIVELLRDKYAHVPVTTRCYLEDIIALIAARGSAQPASEGKRE